MPNVSHKNLTGTNLHEPKGAETATSGQVYVADGAGSGAWTGIDETVIYTDGYNAGRIFIADGAGGGSFDELVWKDLVGQVKAEGSGAGWPAHSAFIGTSIDAYFFGVGEQAHFAFHIPHDYAPGTDLYIHSHWSHNGTAISGNMTWAYEVTYAKGHQQEVFSTPINTSTTRNTTNIATTPRYYHVIDEVQLTSTVPSASLIDTALIEVDGLILVHVAPTVIPTITGGSPNEPCLLTVDIHYQANTYGTKNKAPNFYV